MKTGNRKEFDLLVSHASSELLSWKNAAEGYRSVLCLAASLGRFYFIVNCVLLMFLI